MTPKTKRRRSHQLADVRQVISGGVDAAQVQLQDELTKEGRGELLQKSEFAQPITTQDSLAMKASLGLPWKKLRVMKRYFCAAHSYTTLDIRMDFTDGSKRTEWHSPVKESSENSPMSY